MALIQDNPRRKPASEYKRFEAEARVLVSSRTTTLKNTANAPLEWFNTKTLILGDWLSQSPALNLSEDLQQDFRIDVLTQSGENGMYPRRPAAEMYFAVCLPVCYPWK